MIHEFLSLYVLKNIFIGFKKESPPVIIELNNAIINLPYKSLDVYLFLFILSLFKIKLFLLSIILYDLLSDDSKNFVIKYKTREYNLPRNIYFAVITILTCFLSFSINESFLLFLIYLVPDVGILKKMIK